MSRNLIRTVRLIALFVPGLATFARAADHLQPESSDLFGYDSPEYHRLVRESLLPANHRAYVAALELPSFTREWAVLLYPPTSGKARLVVRVANEQIWNVFNEGDQPSGFATKEEFLGAETATAIAKAWEVLLRETRYPPPTSGVRFEGSTYHFSLFVEGEGQLSGSIWSPDSCSRIGKLVELLTWLRRFTVLPDSAKPSAKPSEQAIRERARILSDAPKLEALIAECRAAQAAEATVDKETVDIAYYLDWLAVSQYCLCGRWPASSTELKLFDDKLHGHERRRNPESKSEFADFDFASARISLDASGQLLIPLPDKRASSTYEHRVSIPDCIEFSRDDLFGPHPCPESTSKP